VNCGVICITFSFFAKRMFFFCPSVSLCFFSLRFCFFLPRVSFCLCFDHFWCCLLLFVCFFFVTDALYSRFDSFYMAPYYHFSVQTAFDVALTTFVLSLTIRTTHFTLYFLLPTSCIFNFTLCIFIPTSCIFNFTLCICVLTSCIYCFTSFFCMTSVSLSVFF
jgi:hypothetical protein